jgi:O-antigen/teichoic acid export membrane protein
VIMLRNKSAPTRVSGNQVNENAGTSRALARGSIALLANSGLNAVLGVVFWLIAARILSPAALGRGSALVSTLWTVSGLCQVNYSRSLSGLLPSAAEPKRLLARVYGLTGALSFAVGLAAAFILPYATADFSYLSGDVSFTIIFAGSVVLWTIFTLEDTALTSVRRTAIIPFENGTYGVLKLVCLVGLWWAGYRGSMALFVSWILPLVVIVLPINTFLFRRGFQGWEDKKVRPERRVSPWLRYDLAGYLMWLAGTLPLPVLVLIRVGAAKAAAFSVSFSIVSSIDLLSLMLGNSLTAELSRASGIMTRAIQTYMRRIWLMVGAVSLFLFILAPLTLQVFGDKYRVDGTSIFRIFMIAALPRSVLFLGIAVQRSRGNGKAILLLQAISALGTVSAGFVFVQPFGGAGMALGWLLASSVAALVSGLLLAHSAVRGRHSRQQQFTDLRKVGQISESPCSTPDDTKTLTTFEPYPHPSRIGGRDMR